MNTILKMTNPLCNQVFYRIVTGCLCLLLTGLTYSGTAQHSSPTLEGTWRASFSSTKPYFTTQIKNYYDQLDATRKTTFENQINSQRIELQSGSSFTFYMSNTPKSGSWQYTGNQLTLAISGGASLVYQVESLSATQLVLVPEDATIASKMIFTKE